MQNTAHLFTKNEAAISVEQLDRYAKGWLLDGEIRHLSKSTLRVFAQLYLLDALGNKPLPRWWDREKRIPISEWPGLYSISSSDASSASSGCSLRQIAGNVLPVLTVENW
jgi:hypothetical protein